MNRLSKENIKSYLMNTMYHPDTVNPPSEFIENLAANTYCRICIRELEKCKVTPFIAAQIARMYLLFKTEYVASILVINRKNRVKKIINFAHNYRARFNNFIEEIAFRCKSTKCQKCIVICNYNHKISSYDELLDIDILYNGLKEHGIILCDVIKIIKGKETFLISPMNDSGYPKSK